MVLITVSICHLRRQTTQSLGGLDHSALFKLLLNTFGVLEGGHSVQYPTQTAKLMGSAAAAGTFWAAERF